MIVDVCTYNGEKDLWDIHYNILKEYVDEFIVVEFDETFSGKPKTPSFPHGEYPQVTYVTTQKSTWEKYKDLAESSPNTRGAEHWKREFMQKESIKDALAHLKDNDYVLIGDVDEVWEPPPVGQRYPVKLKLDVYTYYLNNRSSEEFWGTLAAFYRDIKNECLNHLRSNTEGTYHTHGWHFTSMGGPENVKQKLTDSYTQESYATPTVLDNLEYNISHGKDFLGRDFAYTLDESSWPQYLKDHKDKYKHLCKDMV